MFSHLIPWSPRAIKVFKIIYRIEVVTIILTLLLLFLSSCEDKNVRKLKNDINVVNQQCPTFSGSSGYLLGIKYDDKAKEIQARWSLNEEVVNLRALRNKHDLIIKSIKVSFTKDPAWGLLKEIVNAGAGLRMTYISSKTGEEFTFQLSAEELKDMADHPLGDLDIDKILLENQLVMMNMQYPMEVGSGVELVKVSDRDDDVVYSFRVDDCILESLMMQQRNDSLALQKIIKEDMDEPTGRNHYTLIKSLGKGLTYELYGATNGKKLQISISNEEIRKYLR